MRLRPVQRALQAPAIDVGLAVALNEVAFWEVAPDRGLKSRQPGAEGFARWVVRARIEPALKETDERWFELAVIERIWHELSGDRGNSEARSIVQKVRRSKILGC